MLDLGTLSVQLFLQIYHLFSYSIYHPKEIGPTKREMHVAAVLIQKHIRGFVVRRQFEKLRRKVPHALTSLYEISYQVYEHFAYEAGLVLG